MEGTKFNEIVHDRHKTVCKILSTLPVKESQMQIGMNVEYVDRLHTNRLVCRLISIHY